MIQDASLRQRLGKAGHDIVHTDFNMEGGITRLLDKFHNTGDAAKAIGLSAPAAPEADVNVDTYRARRLLRPLKALTEKAERRQADRQWAHQRAQTWWSRS